MNILLLAIAAAVPASAQRVVTPVVTSRSGAPSAVVTPWTRVSVTPSLSGVPGLSLSLAPSVISPAAPGVTLDAAVPGAALPVQVPGAAVAPAAPAAAPSQGMGALSFKASALDTGVRQTLQDAGPVEKASEGDASALGSEVFRKLTGDDTVVSPASDRGSAAPAANPTQSKMLQALDQVVSVYLEHYAPLGWKKTRFGTDFRQGYLKIRGAVLAEPDIKDREFHTMLADFVASLRDYHAGIQFFSTEKASLPMTILGAGGKYYIARIDRSKLSEADFPYQVGDEVVEFGGEAVADAVKALMPSAANSPKTDERMAQMRLTTRVGQAGMAVPQGAVSLKVRSADGTVHDASLQWNYKPEVVPQDVPVRDGLRPEAVVLDDFSIDLPPAKARRTGLRGLLDRLTGMFAHPHAKLFKELAGKDAENRFRIGSRRSYVPELGKVLWEIPEMSPVYAAVYEDEAGRRIGYLRIPDYMGEETHMQIVAQILSQFQKVTDGLVLDQINNPGGNMFYMHALLSMMTDKPMSVPKHRVLINESDAFMASQILDQAASEDETAKEIEDELSDMESMGMMMMLSRGGAEPILEYARFVLSELKAGRRLTSPTHLFGLTKIEPNAQVSYTKPIVVLVNELDFSAGDFLPAIMQDNGRATILGVKTAGAGGGVRSVEFPNQLGIAGFSYTWTIAERANGDPIENLGVTPDVPYELTADDLRNGFEGYKKAILAALKAKAEARLLDKAEDELY
ncbi:MAG: protease-like activity factor CPAF [Elusimicrobia bacterium]|nr:protease-like activity factor CPAF [Elusimicrobiota bacterium]